METVDYIISFYLDTRRIKSKGLYPVKLNVYSVTTQKNKYYPTPFNFTEKKFQSIWETSKPRNEYNEDRLQMQAIQALANNVAKKLKPFSFTQFEKKYFRSKGEGSNVFYQYDLIIDKYKDADRFSTASNYELSMKSLKKYCAHTKGKEVASLPFSEITPDWLNKYETYMLNVKKSTRTTVAIYLRPLRAVFNTAIAEKEIDIELYPFGDKKYQIPAVKNVKKALNTQHLKQLFEATVQTPEQEKARDFWFFSYACNGINIKDIALLRWENIQEDKIIFYRAKTINTSSIITPITVYLNDFTASIIKKYGNKSRKKSELVFSIISDEDTPINNYNRVKNFTKFINQNLKKLAVNEGITEDISTYWARHSFATNAIRNGASMEFVSEALNHSNLKTTQGYFAGFEDKDKKELMKNIMSF